MKKTVSTQLLRFQEAEVLVRSAALAYHTLLGIIPLLGLGFWYLKRLGFTDVWFNSLRNFLLDRWNVASSSEFRVVFVRLTDKIQDNAWGWAGFSLLLYSVLSLTLKFGKALDVAAGVKKGKKKSMQQVGFSWLRRGLGILGLPIALLISVTVSQWIRADSIMIQLLKIQHIGPFLGMPLAWLTTTVCVFFVYYFIPSVRIQLVSAFYASLVVGPLLELLRVGVGLYARHAVSVHRIYGVFAVIPLVILWVQLSWTVLLTGALWLQPKRSEKAGGQQ